MFCIRKLYCAFHGFGQTKICTCGLALGFRLEPIFATAPAASKTALASKGVKIYSKIIISLCQSKSVTHSVEVCCWLLKILLLLFQYIVVLSPFQNRQLIIIDSIRGPLQQSLLPLTNYLSKFPLPLVQVRRQVSVPTTFNLSFRQRCYIKIHTHTHSHKLTHSLTYTYSHIHTHAHILTHTHIHTHTHKRTHIHSHTHSHTHTHLPHLHTLTHTHTHTGTHTHTLTHTHSHMFA